MAKVIDSNEGSGRGGRRPAASLKERIERAAALRDREIGLGTQGLEFAPSSPVPPPTPPPGPHRPTSSTLGIPGTPIVSGFLEDLGEYNGELAGRNAIPTYEKMRRGDAQVRATLAACKLPVLSAKWDMVAAGPGNWKIEDRKSKIEDRKSKIENRNAKFEDRNSKVESRNAKFEDRNSKVEDRNSPDDEFRVSNFEFRDSPGDEFRISNFESRSAVSSTGAGRNTQAKAREVASFVRENLFGGLEFRTSSGGWVTQNWDDVVRNALLMLDFGCAAHEDVWTVDGDTIRLRKLAARLPLTFYRWHTEADGETLLALEQYGYRGGKYLNVLLPAEKCTVFTYQQEGANFWGIALLRAMYPHWYVKSQLYRIDAIACERNSLGIPVFKLPMGFSKEDRDAAYSFVTQLAAHEATGMVEPPGDATTGFRIVGYEGRVRDVGPSIQHHNVMISRAALALFMDLGQAEHGSRALGKEHGDFFLLALQNLADQIALSITNTTVRRLVDYNFGAGAPVPRLVAANVQARGLEELVDALVRFAQAGLLTPEENLREFIREELALPAERGSGEVREES